VETPASSKSRSAASRELIEVEARRIIEYRLPFLPARDDSGIEIVDVEH
jgi:hypothetical protein